VGLISTFRLIGGAIATAIYTSIQSSQYAAVLPKNVQAAAEATHFNGNMTRLINAAKIGTAAAYNAVPGLTNTTKAAVVTAVKVSNSQGYKMVYLVALAFGGVAILAAFTVKDIKEEQRSKHVAAHLENEKGNVKHMDAPSGLH
jgi:hypothetical protein